MFQNPMQQTCSNPVRLAGCQALLLTNIVTLIALSGLAGFALADNKALATLPAAGYVAGAAAPRAHACHLIRVTNGSIRLEPMNRNGGAG